VLRLGFRPFFLAAGVWAALAMALWAAIVAGAFVLPTAFDTVAWHVHELLFGFVAAAIAGFLLTAIPNWTGRLPLAGAPLAGLVLAWAAGRIAVAVSAPLGAIAAAVIDLVFPTLLLAIVAREIVAGGNWRNLPVTAALAAFLAANVLMHVDAIGVAATGGIGQRLGIATVVLLINLIGGRIIPSFTRNWLVKRGATRLPAGFDWFDRGSLAAVTAALLAWIAAPESVLAGALMIVAAVGCALRLGRWQGGQTRSETLLWSLHLGFAWVPLGLAVLGAAAFVPGLPAVAGLHALTAGAMAGMTLAVMTRATLGHSGRTLTADRWTAGAYGLAALAAASRVAAPIVGAAADTLLWTAALAWCAAFFLFLARYGPILLTPAPESRSH